MPQLNVYIPKDLEKALDGLDDGAINKSKIVTRALRAELRRIERELAKREKEA